MSEEDRENLSIGCGIAIGAIASLWLTAWLFHLGPDGGNRDAPWWTVPYYLTAVGGGFVTWAVSGLLIGLAVDNVLARISDNGRGES